MQELKINVDHAVASILDTLDNSMARHKQKCDYYTQDGVLMCGKCNTPKSKRVPLMRGLGMGDTPFLVPDKCKCMLEHEQVAQKEEEKTYLEKLKEESLKGQSYRTADIHDTTFFTTVGLQQVKLALKYVEKFDRGAMSLVLTGGTGTGKTYTASCIANELINKGYSVFMATSSDILSDVFTLEDKTKIYGKIEGVDLLIIDDLGAERDSAYGKEKMFEVIDKRVKTGKPMIITTNITKSTMENETDLAKKRLYSRILGNCGVVEYNGKDQRLVKGIEKVQMQMEELMA